MFKAKIVHIISSHSHIQRIPNEPQSDPHWPAWSDTERSPGPGTVSGSLHCLIMLSQPGEEAWESQGSVAPCSWWDPSPQDVNPSYVTYKSRSAFLSLSILISTIHESNTCLIGYGKDLEVLLDGRDQEQVHKYLINIIVLFSYLLNDRACKLGIYSFFLPNMHIPIFWKQHPSFILEFLFPSSQ